MDGCEEDLVMIHWSCGRKHAQNDTPFADLQGAAKEGKTLWDQVVAAPLVTFKKPCTAWPRAT